MFWIVVESALIQLKSWYLAILEFGQHSTHLVLPVIRCQVLTNVVFGEVLGGLTTLDDECELFLDHWYLLVN